MTFKLGSIGWPADPREACDLYTGCVLLVVERCGLVFDDALGNPRELAARRLAGEVSEEQIEQARNALWDFIASRRAFGHTTEREPVMARLALSLLPELALGDWSRNLDHVLDLLQRLGRARAEPFGWMAQYFASGICSNG